ncbi:Transcriptional activator NphR [compost metagenome]
MLDWLEEEFPNPGIGLADMAAQLGIGGRQLNEKFRELFGRTAYSYLIQLRIRKAKEWLPARPDWTVRRISEAVGFRDVSHFISTFRREEGMTPEAYRRLYGG